MADATCSADNIGFNWPTGWGTSGILKIISDREFVSGGKPYPSGRISDPINQNFCYQSAITVVSNVATFAAITLPQTDALDIQVVNGSGTPLYTAIIYSNGGNTKKRNLFSGWHLSSSLGSTFNFAAWATDNNAPSVINPRSQWVDVDTLNRALAAIAYAPSSTTQLGIIKTSITPVDTASPIAVENSDPRVNVVYNVKAYGAVGDGSSSLSTALWRAQYGIPSSLANAYLGGNTFGTLTFVDGTDTKDYVAMAYAVYLSGQNRGTYTPVSGVTLVKSIEVLIPDGTYNLNKVIGLYSSYYVTATNAVLVRSGTGSIFDLKDPVKTVLTGIQFQGGTNAIITADSNTDASEVDIDKCMFQGQTSYPIRSSNPGTATPKVLRVSNSKFINTAGGIYSITNQTIIEKNWFEFITTNPVLYNDTDGQAAFIGNRITPGVAGPPDDWIVNGGQLRAEWNIIGGEIIPSKRFLRTITGAQYTSVKHNIVHSATDAYNIQLDVYPINVFIEDNWFQSNNGWIVNDNYVGATGGATATEGAALATSNNTFKNNQQGNKVTPVLPFIAFKNGGLYFTLEGTGLGRTASTREMQVVKPDTDFANLFPDSSESISGSWAASGVTFTNNAVVAPDGATTGINITGAAFGMLDSGSITTAALGGAGVYTLSLYVRNYAAANIVSMYNTTDSTVVVARPLSVGTEWVRLAVSFYAVTGKTYILRFNLVTGGSLNAWGFQINPGYHAAPYLYRGTNAKASVFPFVGPERPVYYAAAMPSTGDWKAGTRVFQTLPAEQGVALSKYLLLGWYRLTTGSGNTLNTDWLEMRTLTGN